MPYHSANDAVPTLETPNPSQHAGETFEKSELLAALVAERIEQLVNRCVDRNAYRIALYGSRAHADWLDEHIVGMQNVPMQLYITWGDPAMPAGSTHKGTTVVRIDDQRIGDEVDCVLIADDRHEKVLYDIARLKLPPRVLIHTLYDRLPIGDEPLPTETEIDRVVRAASYIEATPTQEESHEAVRNGGTNRIASLIAATAPPIE